MISLIVSLMTFVCIFGGALLGLLIQGFLPKHHLSAESKDTVKLGAGLIATMAALVLGLLVGSAKNSFDAVNSEIMQGGAKVILLDRVLAQYGPESHQAREDLRQTVLRAVNKIWGSDSLSAERLVALEGSQGMEQVGKDIRDLVPGTNSQRFLQNQATQIQADIMGARWLIVEEQQTALPILFLIVLIFWLTTLNVTYGLYAPRNKTVVAVLLVCAISVSCSIFLVLEMAHPLTGFIRVSGAPMEKALESLGK
jgi:hypothetical protein